MLNTLFKSASIIATTGRMIKPFHVVSKKVAGVLQTYEIYKDNKPALIVYNGFKLGRKQAYDIARYLNGDKDGLST